ncbi:MAG TPA: phosphohistidine phosphatase SixA [Geobacteraceae bacterium]
MYLYIIRHAEATDRVPGGTDGLRALTCRGRTRFRRVGATLNKLAIAPDLIATSPLIRAVQTAEILASSIASTCDILVVPELAEDFSPTQLRDLLQAHAQCRQVAVVGHEPTLGRLAQALLGSPQPCSLKKGATLCLELAPDRPKLSGTLQWLVRGGGKLVDSKQKALANVSKADNS